MSKDHYQILQVSPNSSKKEIRDSFRDFSLKNHPEKNNLSEESIKKFQEVQESFEHLTDYNKNKTFFPVGGNKLIRLEDLTNKLDDLDFRDEYDKEKKREKELEEINQNKELEKLKIDFLKIYKNGPSSVKYTVDDLTSMWCILRAIENREPNKKLDDVYQTYCDELNNKFRRTSILCKQDRIFSWLDQKCNTFEERISINFAEKGESFLLEFLANLKNDLEEVEKLRYLTPAEAHELKRIREYNKNKSLTPIELESDEKKRRREKSRYFQFK